jgi:hypothetical protein
MKNRANGLSLTVHPLNYCILRIYTILAMHTLMAALVLQERGCVETSGPFNLFFFDECSICWPRAASLLLFLGSLVHFQVPSPLLSTWMGFEIVCITWVPLHLHRPWLFSFQLLFQFHQHTSGHVPQKITISHWSSGNNVCKFNNCPRLKLFVQA